jgi:DNA-binding XRE family transcriptional regulator
MNLKEIKDAARQAFSDQQTQDTEGGVPDAVSFIAGFLAGARYRQPEIDELTSVLDLKKETLVELEEENKKVTEYKELARLQADTITRLERENKKLREALEVAFEDFKKQGYHKQANKIFKALKE